LTDVVPKVSKGYLQDGGLSLEIADQMIENGIGKLSLPLGLGLNFLINSERYIIPMVIEEPSVVAAASSSAKLIKELGGGFKTWSSGSLMTGQIQVLDVECAAAKERIDQAVSRLVGNLSSKQTSATSTVSGWSIEAAE
jgi:degradative hydroxymethylglutaryl-CoA reductase